MSNHIYRQFKTAPTSDFLAYAEKVKNETAEGLATAAGATAAGEMSVAQAVQTAITCLIGIFLRSGMIKA